MDEVWKVISGYEGWYVVSNLGRVKRIKSIGGMITNKILKLKLHSSGYYVVNLSKFNKATTKRVHQLVIEAFFGLGKPGQEPNHKDGDKINNHADNLEWVTKSENMRHAYRELKILPPCGENNGASKLTMENVLVIRYLTKLKILKQREVAGIFKVSQMAISRIHRKKAWAHL